jgi:monovalent cation:H+ antiporter-2, CPA2 family
MAHEILGDLLVLFAFSVGMVVVFHHLRLPPIVAFLATGVLCGPSGLGLIRAIEDVEVLAEIGVVLLLFTVGLEFSLEKVEKLRWFLIVGGGVQVAATAALSALGLAALGWDWPQAVFFGMLVSLSSTAIVIRLVTEGGEVDTPYGRSALAILIFQDLCIVPMVLATPALAGKSADAPLLVVGLKAAAFLAAAGLASRYLVPLLFRLAVGTRRREVFVLSVVLLCVGAAWLSAWAGLSLALGAFIAGLLLSQSEYSHQALGDVLPFREVFIGFFFVSVGLLVDLQFVTSHPLLVLATAAGIVVLKALVAGCVPLLLGHPLRVAAATGLSLAQVGEFSFVLAGAGSEVGLLDPASQQAFLASAVATMALTPWLHKVGTRLYRRTGGPWAWSLSWRAVGQSPEGAPEFRDHVVIVGFGLNGRNLTRVLSSANIPYVAIDVNASAIAEERSRGTPIFYGDATSPETLEHAGVRRARVLVVAISDPPSTRRVVALAIRLNPRLHVIARTRYVAEVHPILSLGAEDVIPEEFETSIEIFARVLGAYLIPRHEVEHYVREVRSDAYEMLREFDASAHPKAGVRGLLESLDFEAVRVLEGSPVAGKTLREAALRTLTGATVVALRRNGDLVPNPEASERLDVGAVAVLLGRPEQLSAAAPLFGAGRSEGDGRKEERGDLSR